jgi:biotin carboxylase
MKDPFDAVAVIDPFSAGALYGSEARRLGLRPYAVLSSTDMPSYFLSSFRPHDFEEVLEHRDLETTFRSLKARKVRALLPGTSSALGLVDLLAARLGLPGNPLASARCRRDKALMKKCLLEHDIPCAAFAESARLGVLRRWSERNGFPVVAKPPQGVATKGVRVCRNPLELEAAFDLIMSLPSLYHGERRRVLVEEYLDGDEFFMNFLNHGSDRRLIAFACYEKIQTDYSAGVYKNIYSLPLDAPKAREACDYVRRVNAALDVQLGINDVEFKLTSRGPRFIELNNRLPGAMTPVMIQRCTGFNCYAENLRLFLGEGSAATRPVHYDRHYCVCCLMSEDSGEIIAIEGLPEVRRLPSLEGLTLFRKLGDRVERTSDLLSTWGLVFLVHEDQQVLRRDAEFVHRTLKAIVHNHSSSRSEP